MGGTIDAAVPRFLYFIEKYCIACRALPAVGAERSMQLLQLNIVELGRTEEMVRCFLPARHAPPGLKGCLGRPSRVCLLGADE